MTMPNQPKPENPYGGGGAYVWDSGDTGSGMDQGSDQANEDYVKELIKQPALTPWTEGQNNFASALSNLISTIVGMIAAGIELAAGIVVGVITTIAEGIGAIFDAIASALGFGGTANPDDYASGTTLADIRDGQRALIGQLNQLQENAGFCNLVMSKNWSIPQGSISNGVGGKYLGLDYDTLVTQNKNAHPEMVNVPNVVLGLTGLPMNSYSGMRCRGIVFDAPGVWLLNCMCTAAIESNNTQVSHLTIYVFRLQDSGSYPGGYREAAVGYSATDYINDSSSVLGGFSVMNMKSVLIPDDGHTYVAIAGFSIKGNLPFTVYGGSVYSQFTANRLSVDTTTYSPHNDATGTVVIQ